MFLTDGKTYDIRHPEMAMITSREVYVGCEETSPGSGIAKECDLVSLLHVVRVEQVPLSPKELPKKLYKYRPVDKYTEQIFTERSLYFAGPDKLNDPFDRRIKINTDLTEEQFQQMVETLPNTKPILANISPQSRKAEIHRWYQQTRQTLSDGLPELRKFFDETGVLCLSELRDQILMWSHYADGHRGICLEFDTAVETSIFNHAQSISYCRELPVFDCCDPDYTKIALKALFRKAPDWEYEKEWRVIGKRKASQTVSFPPRTLTGIILGAKICCNQKAQVLEWCKRINPRPSIYEARLKEDTYGIDVFEAGF
jgi:hypothetical protein